jgi:hypothetical protein
VILGIDIGVTGGIAVLSASGELIEVHAMPCLADGHAGRRAVNGPLLASIVFASHATRAFVEHVSARPGEGAVGAFAFGRSRGVIEGVLAAAGVRCQFLTPACWKRAVGLPPGRDRTHRAPPRFSVGPLAPSCSRARKMTALQKRHLSRSPDLPGSTRHEPASFLGATAWRRSFGPRRALPGARP